MTSDGDTVLAAALRDRGWTVQDLAVAADCHPNALYPLRAGAKRPTDALAGRVAAALDVGVTALFERGDDGRWRVRRQPPATPPITIAEVLARPATGMPRWQLRAACADAPDPEVFWPATNPHALLDRQRAATRVREALCCCARCPVLGDCRDATLATADAGQIVGGLTQQQRDQLRAGRAAA